MRNLADHLWQEWKQLEVDIATISKEIDTIASDDPACQRLLQIPGVGPLISTATVAAIGNGAAFRKGRDFSLWLGLKPSQYSTGGKAKLRGISKRGNEYLRRMFIHGARSLLLRAKQLRGMQRNLLGGCKGNPPQISKRVQRYLLIGTTDLAVFADGAEDDAVFELGIAGRPVLLAICLTTLER